MARVNVFLSDALLKAVDAQAEKAGTNRSALIQTALTDYLEAQQRASEEAEAQRRMDEACKRMDALAEKLGAWDPTLIIRESRESRYGRAGRQGRSLGAGKRA
jgi:predicted transcriptional regulator